MSRAEAEAEAQRLRGVLRSHASSNAPKNWAALCSVASWFVSRVVAGWLWALGCGLWERKSSSTPTCNIHIHTLPTCSPVHHTTPHHIINFFAFSIKIDFLKAAKKKCRVVAQAPPIVVWQSRDPLCCCYGAVCLGARVWL